MSGVPPLRPEDLDPVFREHYGDRARVTMFRGMTGEPRLRAVDPISRRRSECDVPQELLQRVRFDARAAGEAIFKLADDLVKWVTLPEPEPRPGIGRGDE